MPHAVHVVFSTLQYAVFHHIHWLARCATAPLLHMLAGDESLFIISRLPEDGAFDSLKAMMDMHGQADVIVRHVPEGWTGSFGVKGEAQSPVSGTYYLTFKEEKIGYQVQYY